MRLRKSGQLAASLKHFRRAVEADATNAGLHLDLGLGVAASGRIEEALPSFARAIELDPSLALAHFYLAVALLQLGHEPAALHHLEHAAAIAPHVAEVQRVRGGLLGDWGWPEPAAAAFRAAAAAAASPVDALRDRATALRIEGRGSEAEELLVQARALDPNDVQVRLLLGRTYTERGEFAEAERELRFVLAHDPAHSDCAFELFHSVKARDSDRPLLADLAARATRPELAPRARMMLGFALGRAYDQLGEYAEAIRHFDSANAIRAAIAPLDKAELARQTELTIARFSRESLAPSDVRPQEVDERPVFIVGLPRSGTTLVEQVLSSHPQVAAGGELGFWTTHGPRALDAGASDAVLLPLAAAYRSLLDSVDPGAARITDKNPFNFSRLGMLRAALPGARFVHVRRSPIDNAVSLYTTYFSSRQTFFFGNRDDLLCYYDSYVRLMEHWRAVLPTERLLEIEYEALVHDREAQTRRLVEFCGLPWNDACLRPEANPRAINTASIWQARQPVYRDSIGRWRHYAPWLGPLVRLAPRAEPHQRALEVNA